MAEAVEESRLRKVREEEGGDSGAESAGTAPAERREPAAVIGDFKIEAAEVLLEQELRESARYAVALVAGSAAAGSVGARFLDSGLEDVLSLLFAGVGGYLGLLLSLPLKRFETKEKVRRVASAFKEELRASISAAADAERDGLTDEVEGVLVPALGVVSSEIESIESMAAERAGLSGDVAGLLEKVETI